MFGFKFLSMAIKLNEFYGVFGNRGGKEHDGNRGERILSRKCDILDKIQQKDWKAQSIQERTLI